MMAFDAVGRAYVAFSETEGLSETRIRIRRSDDAGVSWHDFGLIGDFGLGAAWTRPVPLILGPPGDQQILVFHNRRSLPSGRPRIDVAISPIGGTTANFATRTVASDPLRDMTLNEVATNEFESLEPTILVTLTRTEGVNSDGGPSNSACLTRSLDQGDTWEAPFPVFGVPDEDSSYNMPSVACGPGGIVHVAAVVTRGIGFGGQPLYYRRAENLAAAGVADFGQIQIFDDPAAGLELQPRLAAAPDGDEVLLTYMRRVPTQSGGARASLDGGLTWPIMTSLDATYALTPFALPDRAGFVVGTAQSAVFGTQHSSYATPGNFGAFVPLADRSYDAGVIWIGEPGVAVDRCHANRVALVWSKRPIETSAPDSLFFDVGAPPPAIAPHENSPIALPEVYSSPALVDLDGDGLLDIVFATDDGAVRVHDHLGAPRPGWPRRLGDIERDSPVAVGDLDGDGEPDIVVGSSAGRVHAYRTDGSPRPGFPVTVSLSSPAYANLVPHPSGTGWLIAACAGDVVTLLDADGMSQPGWPQVLTEVKTASANGDVDGNGDVEIVVASTGLVTVLNLDGSIKASRAFGGGGGGLFSRPPALADLDGDGTLEILLPRGNGRLNVMDHTLADLAGWPYIEAANTFTGAVVADLLPDLPGLEVVFAVEQTGMLHVRRLDGTSVPGFPVSLGHAQVGSPVIADVYACPNQCVNICGHAEVLVLGTGTGKAFIVENGESAPPPGWPIDLPSLSRVSAAVGDLDGDGRPEVIAGVSTGLAIYRSSTATAASGPLGAWPMYGYGPQRRFCAGCDVPDLVNVPRMNVAGAGRVRFTAVYPNPGRRARFAFELAREGRVAIEIHDLRGVRVARLLGGVHAAGVHHTQWNGADDTGRPVAPGLYFARLTQEGAGGGSDVRRVTILR